MKDGMMLSTQGQIPRQGIVRFYRGGFTRENKHQWDL